MSTQDLLSEIADLKHKIRQWSGKCGGYHSQYKRLRRRFNDVTKERDRMYGALAELKDRGFLECVVDPACNGCTVCDAREAIKIKK